MDRMWQGPAGGSSSVEVKESHVKKSAQEAVVRSMRGAVKLPFECFTSQISHFRSKISLKFQILQKIVNGCESS